MTQELRLRPLTARSVVLSTLLGAHPPELPVRELVRIAALFGINDTALRVALTRMVATGDLHRADGTYRLNDRLVQRQRRQDEAVDPSTVAWDGTWEIVAVTATGRSPADRAALRARMTALRLGELREGLWLRPANLRRAWSADPGVQRFTAVPQTPSAELARTLWDLDDWSAHGRALLRHFRAVDQPVDRFTTAAAIVRHLLADPILPDSLLPRPWPADDLRVAYRGYQRELADLAALRSG
ncbi:PaaX family transcriptional regulator C-terminal domain-containing protein [Saccharothrix sp. NPDC042600]|uniref:PaaX family transcriptional regulator C-terminal domain-containing protein n=1 Tax=Saccharothrix TaxID=2071 RepID=UPI0033CEC195|nr:PaaX family transcriptional regulator C-terminal domain-containing protein [Saccharothrix mutabilis subsp. capreolus]